MVGMVPVGWRDGSKGARVVSAAWAIRDKEGQVLPGSVGASRIEVGRKILPGRYDPFRLHVSASYREMFDRQLEKMLTLNEWRIVRVKARQSRRAAPSSAGLVPVALAA
jgi:hypothetical protein